MTGISVKVLCDMVEDRLNTLSRVRVYVGEVDGKAPTKPDDSGRVSRHLILHPGTGRPTADADDVAQTHVDRLWSFQVNCVAGWTSDCALLGDDVWDLLYRWVPVLDGLEFGQVKPPGGFDPGPPRPEKDVKPTRFFLPLQWQVPVTT